MKSLSHQPRPVRHEYSIKFVLITTNFGATTGFCGCFCFFGGWTCDWSQPPKNWTRVASVFVNPKECGEKNHNCWDASG